MASDLTRPKSRPQRRQARMVLLDNLADEMHLGTSMSYGTPPSMSTSMSMSLGHLHGEGRRGDGSLRPEEAPGDANPTNPMDTSALLAHNSLGGANANGYNTPPSSAPNMAGSPGIRPHPSDLAWARGSPSRSYLPTAADLKPLKHVGDAYALQRALRKVGAYTATERPGFASFLLEESSDDDAAESSDDDAAESEESGSSSSSEPQPRSRSAAESSSSSLAELFEPRSRSASVTTTATARSSAAAAVSGLLADGWFGAAPAPAPAPAPVPTNATTATITPPQSPQPPPEAEALQATRRLLSFDDIQGDEESSPPPTTPPSSSPPPTTQMPAATTPETTTSVVMAPLPTTLPPTPNPQSALSAFDETKRYEESSPPPSQIIATSKPTTTGEVGFAALLQEEGREEEEILQGSFVDGLVRVTPSLGEACACSEIPVALCVTRLPEATAACAGSHAIYLVTSRSPMSVLHRYAVPDGEPLIHVVAGVALQLLRIEPHTPSREEKALLLLTGCPVRARRAIASLANAEEAVNITSWEKEQVSALETAAGLDAEGRAQSLRCFTTARVAVRHCEQWHALAVVGKTLYLMEERVWRFAVNDVSGSSKKKWWKRWRRRSSGSGAGSLTPSSKQAYLLFADSKPAHLVRRLCLFERPTSRPVDDDSGPAALTPTSPTLGVAFDAGGDDEAWWVLDAVGVGGDDVWAPALRAMQEAIADSNPEQAPLNVERVRLTGRKR